MVLQQTRSNRYGAQPARLDVNRILGISSTLALNVLALAMLLAPMTLPAPVPRPGPAAANPQIVPIVPLERTLPPPLPPQVVPVTPPRVQPRTVPRDMPVAPPTADVPMLVEQGEFIEAAPEVAPPVAGPASIDPGPAAGMQLQYAHAPSPAYPPRAVQQGLQGEVLLRVLVDADGRPLEVAIERSSGHAILDREALRHVRSHWRFMPALRDGQPVQAVGLVPVEFRLDRY